MSDVQQTVAKAVSLKGAGIHSGAAVSVRVLPAPENTGVVFIRTDLPHHPVIPVRSCYADINKSIRRTTVSKDGVEIQTVEHFMAALWGLGIDNVYVEIDGPEMPGLDGSALQFMQQVQAAGITRQPAAPRRYFALRIRLLGG